MHPNHFMSIHLSSNCDAKYVIRKAKILYWPEAVNWNLLEHFCLNYKKMYLLKMVPKSELRHLSYFV